MRKKVAILGAGIQGSCIALELAKRGFEVELLDQDQVPLNRASIRNEGKIHLGLVYMNDPEFTTPRLMLKGAFYFSHYLERWLGDSARKLNLSTPFYYLVANDSFLTPDQLQKGYSRLQEIYDRQKQASPVVDYLGTEPDLLARRSSDGELSKYFNPDELQGGFLTSELAIDTGKLAAHIRKAVKQHPNVTFLPGHKVHSVSSAGAGYVVEGVNGEGTWKKESPQVVNSTWAHKYQIDQTLGIPAPPGILHRLKYRLVAELPPEMAQYPSATMVIGRFGDVVIRPDATAYVSWYPDACKGWSNSVQPPAEWEEVCKGNVSKEEFERMSDTFIAQTQKWYPAIKKCRPKIVDAGVILAFGKTDVDDEGSKLHERSQLGVSSHGGYHTVYTGKLTTAPLTAMDTADHVEYVVNQR